MSTSTNPELGRDLVRVGHHNVTEAMGRRLLQDRGGSRKPLPEPKPYVYASGWDDCPRRMFHDVVDHYRRPPWSVKVLARFARGNEREDALRIWMDRAGALCEPQFRVYGAQDEIALRDQADERIVLKGKVDSILEFTGGPKLALEFKSWSPYVVDRIATFSDLFGSPYTKRTAYQLAAYVWGKALPGAWLVLDRFNDLPKIVPVDFEECIATAELFWARAEDTMNLVRGAIDHHTDNVEAAAGHAEQVAERLDHLRTTNRDACQRCWCNGVVCYPEEVNPGQATIETDEETIAEVRRMVELAPAAAEHGKIKRRLDKRFRGVEFAIVGDYVGRGKWSSSTTYNVPAEVKAAYKETNPQGRFSISWEHAEAQKATEEEGD